MAKENNFLAIAYILMGMTAFAFQDTAVRLLAVDISILSHVCKKCHCYCSSCAIFLFYRLKTYLDNSLPKINNL